MTLGLRDSLAAFAEDMERILRANDHKGGWTDLPTLHAMIRLHEELEELELVLTLALKARGQDAIRLRHRVIDEAADVANFAMMIADQARNRLDGWLMAEVPAEPSWFASQPRGGGPT